MAAGKWIYTRIVALKKYYFAIFFCSVAAMAQSPAQDTSNVAGKLDRRIINVLRSNSSDIISIAADKLNTTYDFKAALNYFLVTDFGIWHLKNDYSGAVITSISNSYRDIEDFNLCYSYPITKNLFLTSDTKLNILSDRNSISKNVLKKISEQVGIVSVLFDLIDAKLVYGLQENTQANIKAFGHLVNGTVTMPSYNVDDYIFKADIQTELLFLADNRKTSDIIGVGQVFRQYDKNKYIDFRIGYKQQTRNFLQTLSTTQTNDINTYSIENNTDQRITASFSGQWNPIHNAIFKLDLNLENIDVNRSYQYEIATINNSKILRNFVEWNTSAKLSADIEQKNAHHSISASLFNKNENNYLSKKFDIDNNEFNNLQLIESQKDNTSININLMYDWKYQITASDSVKAMLSLTKVEYNTPSRYNNDERDELNDMFSVKYIKKISEILNVNIDLYYTQKHLVFINKQRSSQNNWNRTISLTNGVTIHSKYFYYAPTFEVMANYTIYDFEMLFNSVRSYSVRYLIYRDSLNIKLFKDYYFEEKATFRCYEQSKLYWGSFAEMPQQRSIEYSSTALICKAVSEQFIGGLGGKFYYLTYGQINKSGAITNPNTTFSKAPCLMAKWRSKNWQLDANIWIEHRTQSVGALQIIPNFNVNINYFLPTKQWDTAAQTK